MSVNTSTLSAEIISDLTDELGNEASFDAGVLGVKVKNAIKDVIMRRNYIATSMTDTEIEYDLENYYATILNLARYDYNMCGAEGEKSHSENGTSRTYVDRDSILNGVHAFCKVL